MSDRKHSLGLTADEVKDAMMEVFTEWMNGQTCAILDDTNETLYYPQDVERFIDSMRRRLPRVLD